MTGLSWVALRLVPLDGEPQAVDIDSPLQSPSIRRLPPPHRVLGWNGGLDLVICATTPSVVDCLELWGERLPTEGIKQAQAYVWDRDPREPDAGLELVDMLAAPQQRSQASILRGQELIAAFAEVIDATAQPN